MSIQYQRERRAPLLADGGGEDDDGVAGDESAAGDGGVPPPSDSKQPSVRAELLTSECCGIQTHAQTQDPASSSLVSRVSWTTLLRGVSAHPKQCGASRGR